MRGKSELAAININFQKKKKQQKTTAQGSPETPEGSLWLVGLLYDKWSSFARVANDENSANENNYSPVRVSWESEPRKKKIKSRSPPSLSSCHSSKKKKKTKTKRKRIRKSLEMIVIAALKCCCWWVSTARRSVRSQEASCWMLSSVVCCAELGCV